VQPLISGDVDSYRFCNIPVSLADGNPVYSIGEGLLHLANHNLGKALHVPNLSENLLSIPQF
jgi:hypothetical protein